MVGLAGIEPRLESTLVDMGCLSTMVEKIHGQIEVLGSVVLHIPNYPALEVSLSFTRRKSR